MTKSLEDYIKNMESVLAHHFAPGQIYHGEKGAMRLAREIGPALAEYPQDEVNNVLGSLYTRLLVRFTFGHVPVSAKPWLQEIQQSINSYKEKLMTDQQERFIITNFSPDKIPMTKALDRVAQVVKGGRVSNDGKQFCYSTLFFDGVAIATDLNKASDRFAVYYQEQYDKTLPGQEFEGQISAQLSMHGPRDEVEAMIKFHETVTSLGPGTLDQLNKLLQALLDRLDKEVEQDRQALKQAMQETGMQGDDA